LSKETWRKVRRVIREADVVLEVVDAREPLRTRCIAIEKMAERLGKKIIIVINKADLVPRDVLEKWKKYFSKEHYTIYISASSRLGTRKLWTVIKKVCNKRPVKVAVVGYPNVGKSTVINILKGRHSVGTSPIPGFTKHVTQVRAATWLKVIDTPGVIPVETSNELDLVLKSAIPPEKMEDPVVAAVKFIKYAEKVSPGVLQEIYSIDEQDPYDFLKHLAKKRGLLSRGGEPRLEEAAKIVIRDWQSGKITWYHLPPEEEQA